MWPALCSKVFIYFPLLFFSSKSLPFLSVSQLLFGLCWLLFFPPSSVFLAFIPFGIYYFLGFLFSATATAALCFPRCLSLGNLYAMCVFIFFRRCYAGSLARCSCASHWDVGVARLSTEKACIELLPHLQFASNGKNEPYYVSMIPH